MIVPPEAVQANGDIGTVFVIHGDHVERRAVRLGARNADGQTILSGLQAGDARVAVGDLDQADRRSEDSHRAIINSHGIGQIEGERS